MIARTHFTTKADGQASYHEFKKSLKLSLDALPYEYESTIRRNGKPLKFIAESWGGYFDANNQWRVFIAWRLSNGHVTTMLSWLWDSENKECYGEQEHTWAQ